MHPSLAFFVLFLNVFFKIKKATQTVFFKPPQNDQNTQKLFQPSAEDRINLQESMFLKK